MKQEVIIHKREKFTEEEPTGFDDLVIYIDGSCWPNPGGCGGAATTVYKKTPEGLVKIYEVTASLGKATNQRMELQAMLRAVEYLLDRNFQHCLIKTDSEYVSNAFNKNWILGWAKKNFENRANGDMWAITWNMYRTKSNYKKISIEWVKAHNGEAYNEHADKMAGEARALREKMETKKQIINSIPQDMIGDMLDE